MKGLDGSELDLSKPTGDVLLINFWATWCGPCRQEIPDLAKLSTKYKGRGLRVIGLAVDSGSPDEIKPHVSDLGINYPVYLADDVVDRFPNTGVGLPTTLIANRSGLIVEQFIGARSYEDFERVVVPLLGANP